MRAAFRRVDPGLIDQLVSAPHRFEFFQAVKVLEHLFANEGRPGAGEGVSESIRFRNSTMLAFAPSELESLELHRPAGEGGGERRGSVEITAAFMGMLGIHGALPAHYTERVAERERYHKDCSSRAFLDLFSNRSVGNFYRAWKKYRPPVCYEQNRRHAFLPLVLALVGVGFDGLRDRHRSGPGAIDDEALARFAGVLRQRPLSADVLQAVLAEYLGAPIRIEQFVGKWYPLPAQQRSALGGTNVVLGCTALLGERVWQRNLRVRIWIGPLSADGYEAFLPAGERTAALRRLLSFASGQFEYEIRPMLQSRHVRPARLGGQDGARLGLDSFMISRPTTCDRNDCMFELHPIH